MNISITFRHMEGTEAVKKHAHEKLAKLQKFLRTAMSAQVTLSVEGLEHVADVNIASGSAHFHATERREDMYASIDMVHDKLERQIRGAKGATMAKKRGGTTAGQFAAEAEKAFHDGAASGPKPRPPAEAVGDVSVSTRTSRS